MVAGVVAGVVWVLLNPMGLMYFGITIPPVVAYAVGVIYQLRLYAHQQPAEPEPGNHR